MSRRRIDVRALIEAHELFPKKAFGQNFLVDDNVLDKIARSATRGGEGLVVEIGPGLGSLTAALAATGFEVVAVEKDRSLVPILGELFADEPKVKIVEADATKLDLASLGRPGERFALAGNLPYSVTSPLLLSILAHRSVLSRATVMIQKEVADRLMARPRTKAYGSLTVLFGLYTDIDRVMDVSPSCFWPRPKVTSTVIEILPLPEPRHVLHDPELFEPVLRAAFSQRRKTLRNALRSRFEASWVDASAKDAEIALDRRAETLTVEEFVRLASSFSTCRPSDGSD